MIDFSRSFNAAWERMVFILFQPFDLGKWFVIGFSAFLAGFLDGGNGFNFSGNTPGSTNSTNHVNYNLHNSFSGVSSFFSALQVGSIILLVGVIMCVVFGLLVLLYWIGSRGQFMFLDNIVRNRGEIALPWRAYARQGNRVFVFHLICLALSFGVLLIMGMPALLVVIFGIMHQPHAAVAAILILVALGLVYILLAIAFGIFLFLFREWAIPLMFRHDITAVAAAREIVALVRRFPGPIALFVLLRLALWVGLIVTALVACIVFCCLELIPYLGTVIILPALIFVRCFSLECLAQFGPEYNIWLTDQTPATSGFSPQPPLG